jgi:hypothetical protein
LTRSPHRSTNSVAQARATLADRLRARRPELEQAILTRVCAIADPSEVPDPEYLPGLRRAVLAAIDYSILCVEIREEKLPPIPVPLLSQARIAARNDVSLNTVLQRCAASYTLLIHCIEEEAMRDGRPQRDVLKELRSSQVALLDRLLSALSDEHERGNRDCPGTSQAVLAERVRRLLAGEFVDTSEIPYDFDAHHVGLMTSGAGAAGGLRSLATASNSRLFSVDIGDGVIWGWLGSRHEIDRQKLRHLVASTWLLARPLALGEANSGPAGWRLTHRQAKAAFAVAQQKSRSVAQYADVALLASMSKDELLTSSLHHLYLAPLIATRDGGDTSLATLRAYFASGRNNRATASALGVTRQTIANRLRAIEEKLGGPLETCEANVEAALRLVELDP